MSAGSSTTASLIGWNRNSRFFPAQSMAREQRPMMSSPGRKGGGPGFFYCRGVKPRACGPDQACKWVFLFFLLLCEMILQSEKASCNFSMKETAVLKVSTGRSDSISALQTNCSYRDRASGPSCSRAIVPPTLLHLLFAILIVPKCLCQNRRKWKQSAEYRNTTNAKQRNTNLKLLLLSLLLYHDITSLARLAIDLSFMWPVN